MKARPRPLWRCPKCGARFTTANQSHSCGRFTMAALLRGRDKSVRDVYRRFAQMVRACGRVTVVPQKTRVAFMVRMRFAALYPRKSSVIGTLVLPRRVEDAGFIEIETFSPRIHLHRFRATSPQELEWLKPLVRESYAVGQQKHLKEKKS